MNASNKALLSLLALCAVLLFSSSASAQRFFRQESTWTTRIPPGCAESRNSENYIKDIIRNADWWYVQKTLDWGVPVYYARPSTPLVTVAYDGSSQNCKKHGLANGWNIVPLEPGWRPAGNNEQCSGQYMDGMMVVISADGKTAWDFQQGRVCKGVWKAGCVRKRDLTTEGDIYPYDMKGAIRAAYTQLLQGLLMWDDWSAWRDSGKHIDHALAFVYSAETHADHSCVYPCGGDRRGPNFPQRPSMMRMGERIQLDPEFDCARVGNSFTRMVCYALQEYGMIFVDSTSPGWNFIVAEVLDGKPDETRSWKGIIPRKLEIPLDRLRVVDPVRPAARKKQ